MRHYRSKRPLGNNGGVVGGREISSARYENTVKICKSSPVQVNPSDLTFATKFVAMYLFIKVKGSRPMTYQYLTLDMIATAKEKDGFIDQKTAGKYGFDSLVLMDADMQVLDGYISYVGPLLKPQCDFVLVNRNGGQDGKLGEIMSKLVFGCNWEVHSSYALSPNCENGKPQSAHQRGAKDFVGRPETQFCGCQSSLSKAEIARSCCEGSRMSTKASRKQGVRGGRRCTGEVWWFNF